MYSIYCVVGIFLGVLCTIHGIDAHTQTQKWRRDCRNDHSNHNNNSSNHNHDNDDDCCWLAHFVEDCQRIILLRLLCRPSRLVVDCGSDFSPRDNNCNIRRSTNQRQGQRKELKTSPKTLVRFIMNKRVLFPNPCCFVWL